MKIRLIGKILFVFSVLFLCGRTVNAQSPTCSFKPIAYILEKKDDGKLYPLRSPSKMNFGIINDKRLANLGNNYFFWWHFDKKGEYDQCKDGNCKIVDNTCCGGGKTENNYNIVSGDTAHITLEYDKTAYKLIQQCPPYSKCVNGTEIEIKTIKNVPIACGRSYRYGWVVERKKKQTSPQPTKIENKCDVNFNGCDITQTKAEVRDDKKIRVQWTNPVCNVAKEKKHEIWVDVVDSRDNKIVCASSLVKTDNDYDDEDATVDCVLGTNKSRYNNNLWKEISIFDHGSYYVTNVYITKSDGSCLKGPVSIIGRESRKNVPGPSGQQPTNAPGPSTPVNPNTFNTFGLILWDSNTPNQKCWAEGNNSGNNNIEKSSSSKYDCKGQVNRNGSGTVTSLSVCYQNKTGATVPVVWQVARCPENKVNCQQPNTGPNGDRVEESAHLKKLLNNKWYICTWQVNKLKNPSTIEEQECQVNLTLCPFLGDSNPPQPNPTTPPNPPACPEGKLDAKGKCDDKCCNTDADCPSDQTCNVSNSGCKYNKSCGKKSTKPTPPSQPINGVGYTIEIRNTSIRPPSNGKEIVKNTWPHAKIEYYDQIVDKSISRGWNPAFVLALWMEETGASTTTKTKFGGAGKGYSNEHIGCKPSIGQQISTNLECLFNNFGDLQNNQFEEFAKRYCGPNQTIICANNPNFLRNLRAMYDKLVPQSSSGATRNLSVDVNQDGMVNSLDYLKVLLQYNNELNAPEDINGDFSVNATDLSLIFKNLGSKTETNGPSL